MRGEHTVLKVKLQLYCGEEIAMGPGKADLLEAIMREGSISGAGRALGMSYRRAWLLVDAMNRCWHEPLVATTPGGAEVTPLGEEVLHGYRALVEAAGKVRGSEEWSRLQAVMRPAPKEHQKEG